MVLNVARTAAIKARFGFLCVIDGARSIYDAVPHGHLELYYVHGEDRILLNDINREPLNDQFEP